MWLKPQKIKDNSFETSNKAYVFYLPISSSISLYLLFTRPIKTSQTPNSFVRILSNSSAESLNLNFPFIATAMRPVSSDTTTVMASLCCDIPMAAR